MRVTKPTLLTALFLAVVQAQRAEQQANQAAFEAHQHPIAATNIKSNGQHNQQLKNTQQQHDQKQQLVESPQGLTPEEFEMAKNGIRQILGQLPIQHVEPLINTMEGYCKTFGTLCTVACKERMIDNDEEGVQGSTKTKTALSLGCANPKALTIGTAGASCQCASYDMTDRINFAIVGGIVTSHEKKSSDFGAEGILDAITFLPSVPTFLSIIHVLQSISYYISYLDILATNAHPPSCPVDAKPGGGETGGFWSGIFGDGGGSTPVSTPTPAYGGGIGGFLREIFGDGGGSIPAPTPKPASGGGIGGFLRGIFGDGGGSIPAPTPKPASGDGIGKTLSGVFGGGGGGSESPTSMLAPPAAYRPTPTTTTATTSAPGGILGFLDRLFGGGVKPITTTTTTTTITTQLEAVDTITPATTPAAPGATATSPVAAVNTGGAMQQTGLTLATITATATISVSASSLSATPKKDGPLFDFPSMFGLSSEMDKNENLVEIDSEVGGIERDGKARVKMEVDEDEKDERRLISNDGRVARIVRVKRRYAKKMSREQQQKKQQRSSR
ncbi:hypothetical protein BG015_002691 [Linnemannia schmuckeri]|uniref:Uncharacterized protein n=1 Tax=Linnemannia schmuckeri TaxID=64567 RepID=A0A9P5VDM8_9FUNG|nr:hypothetical protein BG015_002691 [Linnemannia schmuckeri]